MKPVISRPLASHLKNICLTHSFRTTKLVTRHPKNYELRQLGDYELRQFS